MYLGKVSRVIICYNEVHRDVYNEFRGAYGGAMYGGRAENCLIYGNSGLRSSVAYDADILHCTITDNNDSGYVGESPTYCNITGCPFS